MSNSSFSPSPIKRGTVALASILLLSLLAWMVFGTGICSRKALSAASPPGDSTIVFRPGSGITFPTDSALEFRKASIEDIMKAIGYSCKVLIVYEGAVPEGTYSGRIKYRNGIAYVVSMLNDVGIRCRFEGEKIVVN